MITFSFFAALYKQRGAFLTTFSFLLRFTKKEAHLFTFFLAAARPGRGRAAARQKKCQKMCLFFCKAQQKRKSGQKSASLFVKRSIKRKSGQKSASLLVKRSKNAKMSKKWPGRAGPCQPGRAIYSRAVPCHKSRALRVRARPESPCNQKACSNTGSKMFKQKSKKKLKRKSSSKVGGMGPLAG